jgi:DNA mismatch repair protein MutS2
MDEQTLRRLEYDRIIAQLAAHTAFSASHTLALALRPSADEAEVRHRLQETDEAKALLSTRVEITVGAAHDVRAVAHHATLQATLRASELLDIHATLLSARRLRYALLAVEDDFPLLASRAEEIEPLSDVIDAIGRCLGDDGEVLDSASPALARIRQQSFVARQRLLDRLRNLIGSSENARFLQEPIVTERGGRFVVPLKAEFKGRIPGIIHDQSASGATLFIEPLATVELNNNWQELLLAEKREVERILAELSHLVGREAEGIIHNVEVVAQLDLAFAKAHYSFGIRGVPAEISPRHWPLAESDTVLPPSGHPLRLVKARHPLLERATVVPIDVHLGGNYSVMLITGPNTGGKTVTLKTLGLLAAMSQAGLHIPAGEGSRLPVFSGIYADIGDEQSIAQSLSTFSSHLSHIVDLLQRADSGSLVLLDEVGAGTDPIEGAALAQALIGELLERRCLAACSSHYSQLKVYAFSTPGVQNASVEFDVETLSPTYRLIIGLPGRSNAFAIAEKLGLSPEIIDRAREQVAPEATRADALLDKVKTAREAAEEARLDVERRRARLRELEDTLRRKLANIEEARRQVLEQARDEGRRELEFLRYEIRRLQSRLITQPAASEAIKEVVAVIEQLAERVAPLAPVEEPVRPCKEPLRVGDTVYITTLDQKGQLLSLADHEAEVALGGFRLRIHPARLEFRAHAKPAAEEAQTTVVLRPRGASPGMELDLRGMRAEQVGPIVDKYLDDAYLAALPWAHIIHGKGTGVLKEVVRQMLPRHPLVESYRPGELAEGGDGITVVKLHKVEG